MDTYMDAYCERTAPGLLAEPLNAITNASFLIAAWAARLLARRSGRLWVGVQILLWLSVSVGIGSIVWHTLATAWALWLDIVPILLFLAWFFWLYLRSVAGMPTPSAVAAIVAFLPATVFAQGFADVHHGALYYTPALILLLVLGAFHAREREGARSTLLATAGVYALALVFRTVNPTTGRYVGGDAIEFYRKLKGLTYKRTVHELGGYSGRHAG